MIENLFFSSSDLTTYNDKTGRYEMTDKWKTLAKNTFETYFDDIEADIDPQTKDGFYNMILRSAEKSINDRVKNIPAGDEHSREQIASYEAEKMSYGDYYIRGNTREPYDFFNSPLPCLCKDCLTESVYPKNNIFGLSAENMTAILGFMNQGRSWEEIEELYKTCEENQILSYGGLMAQENYAFKNPEATLDEIKAVRPEVSFVRFAERDDLEKYNNALEKLADEECTTYDYIDSTYQGRQMLDNILRMDKELYDRYEEAADKGLIRYPWEEINRKEREALPVILCTSYNDALKWQEEHGQPAFTVEAEYGIYCIEGKFGTLAHHDTREDNPAPCNTDTVNMIEKADIKPGDYIMISHIDLDTLGGLMKIRNPYAFESILSGEFAKAAEYLDVNGSHHKVDLPRLVLNATLIRDEVTAADAYLIKTRAPGRPVTGDVTKEIDSKIDTVNQIVNMGSQFDDLIRYGQEWEKTTTKAIEERLVTQNEYVRLFDASDKGDGSGKGPFCNAEYTDPKGNIHAAIVTVNALGGITLSFESAKTGMDARAIMQEEFGPEAGGREGIAGSPREWGKDINEVRLLAGELYEKMTNIFQEKAREEQGLDTADDRDDIDVDVCHLQ